MQKAFNEACKNGNIEQIEYIFQFNVDYNIYYGFEIACAYKQTNIAKYLLKKTFVDLGTCLEYACMTKNLDIINIILESIKQKKSKSQYNALGQGLYSACSKGDVSIVNIILNEIKLLDYNPNKTENLNNGIYIACEEGHVDVVKLLLNNGAICNEYDLISMCYKGYINIAKLILEKQPLPILTSMTEACSKGHIEVVKFLLEYSEGKNIISKFYLLEFFRI